MQGGVWWMVEVEVGREQRAVTVFVRSAKCRYVDCCRDTVGLFHHRPDQFNHLPKKNQRRCGGGRILGNQRTLAGAGTGRMAIALSRTWSTVSATRAPAPTVRPPLPPPDRTRTPSTHGPFDVHFSSNIYFEVINPHIVGSLTIPRASIKWV